MQLKLEIRPFECFHCYAVFPAALRVAPQVGLSMIRSASGSVGVIELANPVIGQVRDIVRANRQGLIAAGLDALARDSFADNSPLPLRIACLVLDPDAFGTRWELYRGAAVSGVWCRADPSAGISRTVELRRSGSAGSVELDVGVPST